MACSSVGLSRCQRCARVAGILLAHVNILLVLYSGAGLATAARLKWDPSTYIPAREFMPKEYPLICALLLLFSLGTLALANLAIGALSVSASSASRRPLLFTYAAIMTALILVEVGAIAWVVNRVLAFLNSPAAARLKEMMEVREHLMAALEILARLFKLPDKINNLINEAIADAPRNGYVAGGAAAALIVLQPLAVVLALVAATLPRAPPTSPETSTSTLVSAASARAVPPRAQVKYHSDTDKSVEEAPLRTAYKNGRLVLL